MEIVKTYKYKLRPTAKQGAIIDQWIHTCRAVYNIALETKIHSWQVYNFSYSKFDLIKQLPELKRDFPWIGQVHSQSLQDVIERMDLAYQFFFKGGGFPKWAARERYRSFAFKQGVHIEGRFVRLPKLGRIKFFKSRQIEGEIKRTMIIREADGYYACFTCKLDHENQVVPTCRKQVGLDLGVAHFVASSDGLLSDPHQQLKAQLRKLRIEQRSLARKKKFGRNWRKQKERINKLHQKIRRKRSDQQHKLSTMLINEYGRIAVEDLRLRNMTRSAKGTIAEPGNQVKAKSGLNRSILDAGMGSFVNMLEYKADWYGRELVKVDPKYSSQKCSKCGEIDKANRKRGKFFCTSCGHDDHADVNAAKNILARAMASGSKRKALA